MSRRWVLAGGGTGGHVTPAIALGEVIRERGDDVLFIGSDAGIERELVPREGFELVALRSRQVMGQGALGRARSALGLLAAVPAAQSALARFAPDFVISVGGYAALPAVLAATLRRTPFALLEPNARPGRVNRLSAPLARRIFVAFDAAADRLGRADRVRNTGIPLRRGLVEAFARSEAPRRRPRAPFRLLVFGGSQGARQLNEAMMALARELATLELEIVHQTGEADRGRVAEAYEKAGVAAEVVAFERDMPRRYRWADLALCRAGAVTVAELSLAGIPAILVPYPYAADDHQAANARALETAGAARCLDGRRFDAEALRVELRVLLADPARLVRMGAAARSRARPGAARAVVDECAALLEPEEAA